MGNTTNAELLLADLNNALDELDDEQKDDRIEKTNALTSNITMLDMEQNSDKLVPDTCTTQEDYDLIFNEFLLGSTIRERAFYRIWRIRNNKTWDKIFSPSGDDYKSFGDMVKSIASNESLGIGRQIIYDRVKTYDQLEWAGYNHGEIIAKVSARPSLYQRVVGKIIDWNNEERKPDQIRLSTTDNLTEDEAKEELRDLIEEIEAFPRQLDALDYVDENILHMPQVKIWMEDDAIVLDYVKTSVEQDGSIYIEDQGVVRYYPNQSVPEWCIEELRKKIK